jgi:hypothetical protein
MWVLFPSCVLRPNPPQPGKTNPPNLPGPEGLPRISPALPALGKGAPQIQSRRDGPRRNAT